MKTISKLIVLFILFGYVCNAQVKDISVTLSPVAEYTWWDNHAGLNDGALVGGKVGFGFGEFFELRGVYLQSYDLTTNFENFGLANFNASMYEPLDVTLTRWGGEMKANVGTKKLKPYITLGTGVQYIEIPDQDKLGQIYASAGFGIKLNLFPRAVFSLEAKNTTYNFNAGNLLTSADKTNFEVTVADFSNERLSNWALQGALEFYLGGRKPGTLSELDQAYLRQFRGGLRDIRWIIEPSVNYIDFNDKSLFRDTWMVGGYAGVDITEYIGLRGFYFQAVEEMKLSTDFDKLSMYGMELRARLNDGNGITPYLTLGGGYLNPENNYLGIDNEEVKGGGFATGGLGLNIPLGKRVLVTGGAHAMLTSGKDALDISQTEEIQTNLMYTAGIKISFGKKSKSPEAVYEENLNRELDYQMALNNQKVRQMKGEYQSLIDSLEQELNKAYDEKDVDKAVELIETKNDAKESLQKVEKLEKMQENKQMEEFAPKSVKLVQEVNTLPGIIRMSPAELESLIVKILEVTRYKSELETTNKVDESVESQQIHQQQIELLNTRIDLLEKQLLEIYSIRGVGEQKIVPEKNKQESEDEIADDSKKILDELEELNRKIETNSYRIEAERGKAQTIFVTPTENASASETVITSLDDEGKIISNQKLGETESALIYENTSAMIGINFGGATTTNFGVRLNYEIRNTPLLFMPEIYIGPGNGTSFGISGNIVFPFMKTNEKVRPYAGLGLGLARIDRNLQGNYNVILGAQLPFITENLSIDYTMRNSFDNNQIAIIYRLPF